METPDHAGSQRSQRSIAQDIPARVPWREVATFVGLAFALAWVPELAALAKGVRFASLSIGSTALLAAIMITPTLAAALTRRFITREGFATAGLRRGPWKPYLVIWVSMPFLVAGIYALTIVLGLGRFDPTVSQLMARIHEAAGGRPIPDLPPPLVLAAVILAQSLTLGAVVTTVFTFGEEFGWTGYLLVKLLPLGRWKAAVVYGAIWGAWHAPVIVGGYNYPGYPRLGPVMMCFLTIAFALSQTALRLRFNSVIVTSFFHASINTQGLSVIPLFVLGVSPVLGGVTGLVGIAVFGLAGAWLLARTPEPAVLQASTRP